MWGFPRLLRRFFGSHPYRPAGLIQLGTESRRIIPRAWPNYRHVGQPQDRAFTLIELLVAIAVIAVCWEFCARGSGRSGSGPVYPVRK